MNQEKRRKKCYTINLSQKPPNAELKPKNIMPSMKSPPNKNLKKLESIFAEAMPNPMSILLLVGIATI